MRQRIIQLRKDSKLSQAKFAESLGLGTTFINLFENGNRELSDRTISDICRVYNVNETWLRTGEGEMRAPLSREEEIASITAQLYKGSDSSIRYKLILMLSQMSEDDLQAFVNAARKIVEFVDEKENGLE